MHDQVGDFNPSYWFATVDLTGVVPEYMKTASVITAEEVQNLGRTFFADPHNRLWPLHTKEATLLSIANYYPQDLKLPAVEEALKLASQAHDIEEDAIRVRDALLGAAQPVKAASQSQPRRHAVYVQDGEKTIGVYPCEFPGDLIRSAAYLPGDLASERISLRFARDAARELVKRAHELRVDLSELPEKTRSLGEMRAPSFDNAERAVRMRQHYSHVPDEAVRLYTAVLDSAKTAHYEGADNLDEYLLIWEDLDAAYGVKYSAVVESPIEALYSGAPLDEIEKLAREVVFVGDQPLPTEVVLRVSDHSGVMARFSRETALRIKEACALAGTDPFKASAELSQLPSAEQDRLIELALEAA